MMGVVRRLPLGSMLLVAVIPYESLAPFSGMFPLWHAHRAALVAVLVVLLVAFVLRRFGCSPAKASVVAAIPVLTFQFVQPDLLFSPVIPTFAGLIALFAAAIDSARRYENANIALTAMGAVLLVGTASPLVQSTPDRQLVDIAPDMAPLGAAGGINLASRPSIIHIVLDGYGATEPLADIYGHDTAPFFAQLEQRGFVVIENALVPYSQTLPSMASVMSGGPVNMTDDRGDANRLRADLGYTIRNGPVPAVLEASGYTFARAESGYDYVDFGGARDVTRSQIKVTLFDTLLLRAFGDFFGPVHNRILKDALRPGTLDDLPQPFFYYQHLLAPHPPFTIAADGSPRQSKGFTYVDGSHFIAGKREMRENYIEGYREKASFIETAVLSQIDAFPAGPRIVIIHGDHGPGAYLDHENAERTCMGERLQTFVAVYSDVPGVSRRLLSTGDERFSTVNIYRAVLSALMETELPLVAATSQFLQWSDPTAMVRVDARDIALPCNAAIHAELGN